MANSSTVAALDDILASQYNNLRSDVLSTSTGHLHDGTNGRLHTNFGVGTAPSTSRGLLVDGTVTSAGTTQYGAEVSPTLTSAATTAGAALYGALVTAAAAYTMVTGSGLLIDVPTIGAASAVTTQRGIFVANQGVSGVTNAYGIDVAAQSGAATVNVGVRIGGGSPALSITAGGQTITAGGLGVGIAAPVSQHISVSGAVPTAAVVEAGILVANTSSGTTNTTAFYGFQATITTPNTAYTTATVAGLRVDNIVKGTAHVFGNLVGISVAGQTAVATNAWGFSTSIPTGGTTQNVGVRVTTTAAAGTTNVSGYFGAPTGAGTNNYGLYVETPTGAATINYGAYFAGGAPAIYVEAGGATINAGGLTVTAGNAAINGAIVSNRMLSVTGSVVTAGANETGVGANITSTGTTNTGALSAIAVSVTTANASYTTATVAGITVNNVTKGASNTITALYGLRVLAQTAAAGSSFGVFIEPSTGATNNYALGTAAGAGITIGGNALRATTQPTNQIDIFNGTAPVGTLTNGVTLYAAAGELRVMDAGGTSTLLSPHDENDDWVFDSWSAMKRKRVKIDVEQMLRRINAERGWDYVHEYARAA